MQSPDRHCKACRVCITCSSRSPESLFALPGTARILEPGRQQMSTRQQPSTAHTNCSHTSPKTNTPDLNTCQKYNSYSPFATRTTQNENVCETQTSQAAIDSKLHNTAMQRGGLAALQQVKGEACVTCPVHQPVLRTGWVAGCRWVKIEGKKEDQPAIHDHKVVHESTILYWHQ